MSRWTDAFNSFAREKTDQLLELLQQVEPDDLSAINSVSELIRLKKVINYIDEVLNSLDPELVPIASWELFSAQVKTCLSEVTNYQSNRNIGHIQLANTNADNMLNYVRPYLIQKGKVKTVYENIFAKTQIDLESYLQTFQQKANKDLQQISETLVQSVKGKESIDVVSSNIDDLNKKLFGDGEDEEGLSKEIEDFHTQAEAHSSEIEDYHSKLLEDTPKQDSIQTEVENARKFVLEEKANVVALVVGVEKEIKELSEFYITVFGKMNDDDETVGGLSAEITLRLATLRELESTNKIRYDAVVEEIQSLLPGATSAGLATAYKDMKDSFTSSIKRFEWIFYSSISLLIILSVLSAMSFSLSHTEAGFQFAYGFIKYSTLDQALRENLFKLPLYGALIWLVFFASKRRSEAQRLQQEYAHKEALAKSYGSYKKQLEDLDVEDKELQKDFIKKTIDAITYNASQTLDGVHGDNHPAKDLMEKVLNKFPEIKLEDFKKFFK